MADSDPDATITMTFNCDIRSFAGNPHRTDTPFGRPEIIGIGNVFADLERAHDEIVRLKAVHDALLRAISRALSAE